jgi:O-antigen ligase
MVMPKVTRKHPTIHDSGPFIGLLITLLWAPIPLASNRTWAIGVLLLMTLSLAAWTAFAWRGASDLAWARLARFKWPLLLLGGLAVLVHVQNIPLPASLLQWLSPEGLRAFTEAGVITRVQYQTVSTDPFQSGLFSVLSTIYFLVFGMSVLMLRDARRIEKLAVTLVISGLIQAIIATLLFATGASYSLFFAEFTHSRALGTFVYSNNLAAYLMLTLSVGIGLMLSHIGRGDWPAKSGWRDWVVMSLRFLLSPKMRLRLMLVVMVIALVLTRSRMGNVAFFAAMLVTGLIGIVLYRKSAPGTTALITSLVIIDLLVIGGWVGVDKVVERVKETSVLQAHALSEETVEKRVEPAKYALGLISDFPLLGSGAGSFYQAFARYRPPEVNEYFDHAHNDYIEITCDTGLMGISLIGLFVLGTVYVSLNTLRANVLPLARGMSFGVLMACIGLMLHSSVDFHLQIPAIALTVTCICAYSLDRRTGHS